MKNIPDFKKITATFEIVTPMFIGDGLQQADSVRPTSVKGALRFWWRALVWPQLIDKFKTQSLALDALHEQEVLLFGAAVKGQGADQTGGQGLVSVRVFDKDKDAPVQTLTNWPVDANSGSRYIAYGLLSDKESPHRSSIKEGYRFTVQLNCRKITDKQEQELKETLMLFGRMGALGARARRANGCVQIIDLDDENCQLSSGDYRKWVTEIFNQSNNYPPFTALNQHCLSRFLNVKRNARAAHGEIGQVYKYFRSGTNKKIRGRDKEKLGLPLKGVNEKDRRASPLFLHIYKLDETSFLPVMLFIPADFNGQDRDMTTCYTPVLPLLEG